MLKNNALIDYFTIFKIVFKTKIALTNLEIWIDICLINMKNPYLRNDKSYFSFKNSFKNGKIIHYDLIL